MSECGDRDRLARQFFTAGRAVNDVIVTSAFGAGRGNGVFHDRRGGKMFVTGIGNVRRIGRKIAGRQQEEQARKDR